MNIVTHHEYPPIPTRNFDWSAVDDDTYDGLGCKIGWGATEAEARADLIGLYLDDDAMPCPRCGAKRGRDKPSGCCDWVCPTYETEGWSA